MMVLRQKEYSAETAAIGSAVGGVTGLVGAGVSNIGLKKRLKKDHPEMSDEELNNLADKIASGRFAKATVGGMAAGALVGGLHKGKGKKEVKEAIKEVVEEVPIKTRPARVHTEGLNDSAVIKPKFKRSYDTRDTRSMGLWGR